MIAVVLSLIFVVGFTIPVPVPKISTTGAFTNAPWVVTFLLSYPDPPFLIKTLSGIWKVVGSGILPSKLGISRTAPVPLVFNFRSNLLSLNNIRNTILWEFKLPLAE